MVPPGQGQFRIRGISKNRSLIARRRSNNPCPFSTRNEWTLNDFARLVTVASTFKIQHTDTPILFYGRLANRIFDGRLIKMLIIIYGRPALRTDPASFPKHPTNTPHAAPRNLQIISAPSQGKILALPLIPNPTRCQPMPRGPPRLKILRLHINRGNNLNFPFQPVLKNQFSPKKMNMLTELPIVGLISIIDAFGSGGSLSNLPSNSLIFSLSLLTSPFNPIIVCPCVLA
jgi:hypothetical protein